MFCYMFAIFLLYFCIYIYIYIYIYLVTQQNVVRVVFPSLVVICWPSGGRKHNTTLTGTLNKGPISMANLEKYEKSKPYLIFFLKFMFFLRSWVNGLDLNRFCAPEQIIEMSNSSFFLDFGFFLKNGYQ